MNKERGGGILFLAVGIYGLIFSAGLPLGKWNEPGPGVFPLALSILLCVSGVLWLIRGKRKDEKKDLFSLRRFAYQFKTPLQIVGLTGAFILVLGPLGYIAASTLYMFVLLIWVSRYRFWVAVVLALAFGP